MKDIEPGIIISKKTTIPVLIKKLTDYIKNNEQQFSNVLNKVFIREYIPKNNRAGCSGEYIANENRFIEELGTIVDAIERDNSVSDTEYNVLMIADEVQTGLGRTGKMLACDHYNVRPDILCLGKALSGGFYPISAVLSNEKIMSVLTPGTHGSTFGGNPLASAIGIEAINVIQRENLCNNAEKLGHFFREYLLANNKSIHVKSIHGIGLLNAIDFHSQEKADEFVEQLINNHIFAKTTREATVRITPPLVISLKQMSKLVKKIVKVLDDL